MAPASIDWYLPIKGELYLLWCGLLLVLSVLGAMREACYKDKADTASTPFLFVLS